MLGFLKDWILNIAALVLFLVIIEILMPSGRMKKYCELVTGVILIIAIINPFVKFIDGGFNFEDIQVMNSNALDKMEIEKNSRNFEEEEMKQITEVYRKKIIRQLEDKAMKAEGVADAKGDVIINEDYTSDTFGEVMRIYLEIKTSGDENGIKPVTKVKEVKIGEEKEPEAVIEVEPQLKKKLEDSISSMFSLDRENIVISKVR